MLRKKLSKSGHHTEKWNVTVGRRGEVRVVVHDVLENMELFLNSPCLDRTEMPAKQRWEL